MQTQVARMYVSCRKINLETGLNTRRIPQLAAAGLIGVQAIPGTPVRYCLQDALALKARYTTVGKIAAEVETLAMAC